MYRKSGNFFKCDLLCKTFALIIFKIYVTRNYFYNIVPNPITKLRISYAVSNKQQTHTTRTKCQTYVGTCTDSFCFNIKVICKYFWLFNSIVISLADCTNNSQRCKKNESKLNRHITISPNRKNPGRRIGLARAGAEL